MSDESEALSEQVELLLARVDELESRAAMRDLVSDYCIGFDRHDWDRFIAIWHKDAVWAIGEPFGSLSATKEFVRRYLKCFTRPGGKPIISPPTCV